MNNQPNTPCALCGRNEPLRMSHVLPAFVFRWLKDTSATGHIRFGQAPNKRVQDGVKLELLCADCEERLSQWETAFANNLFHPVNTASHDTVRYGRWLLLFCVSVSWRVLTYLQNDAGISHLDATQHRLAQSALVRWSECMLGTRPHPGQFEQHVLPLDPIESHSVEDLPANINRYFLRAVELDVLSTGTSAYTYVKLGRFALFGVIQPHASRWIGTKVHVKTGLIDPGEYSLPGDILGLFIDKAKRYGNIRAEISDKQQDKIREAVQRNVPRVQASGTLAALRQDQKLFGKRAFSRHAHDLPRK